ncbi:MAG: 1-(5-phosphoribosyl)-5-[(5-phosphoribosylamino)methylideneamino]imidazole-4-carboxamide isomerase [Acidobacteria bacterium 13_1_20CM_3_53_8]|nr:MAG: 1-(5-phosphoribosyl)-5-[(5-phosphoribosylamino)methylideneamino]imidazole-4-carboxamide isomerase [Acidobacteria bacterium 13_1_20CM_3_53_8]
MLVIPAIDLRGGRCVRLTQGRKEDVKVYDANPVEVAREFARAGAQMIHVVDLDGAFAESSLSNRRVVEEIIRSAGVRVEFGGGMRAHRDVEEMIERGAARVVIGTLAVESTQILEELVGKFGAKIAVGIDAREGKVLTRGWEKKEELSAIELAQRVARIGVERIIYTDVARDGMLGGVNIEQTCALAQQCGVRVTASGGVSSLADIERLKEVSDCGVDSVIVGKALYEGWFTLQEALRVASD